MHGDGPTLGVTIAEACSEIGRQAEAGVDAADIDASRLLAEIDADPEFAGRLLAAFGEERLRATPLSTLANAWFSVLGSAAERAAAVRGLFIALAHPSAKGWLLPRLRFHWMARNVDGLWAVATPLGADERRRVGPLFPDPAIGAGNERVLEVLYCECCGTQFLCGHKIVLDSSDMEGAAANPCGIPGIAMPADSPAFELTVVSSQLAGLQNSTRRSERTRRSAVILA